jgi:hypothetical protein
MSLVHELEDVPDSESSNAAGVHNETLPQMAPRFTKPNNMNHVVTKPAGSTVSLSCPAEGEYTTVLLKETSVGFKTAMFYSMTVSTGNPEPNITWSKGRDVLSNVRYSQWSLKLEDTVVHDSGNYTCFICNINGCISFTFEVNIIGMFSWICLLCRRQ